MTKAQRLVTLGLLAVASCMTPTPSREAGAGAIGENVLSGVPALVFGQARFGHVGDAQIDAYTIELRNGDQIEVDMGAEDGLGPALTLFQGLGTKMSPSSREAAPQRVVNRYSITASGTHYVIVRAFEGGGEGDYAVWVRCAGGPCAGDPSPTERLDGWQTSRCIRQARALAIERIGSGDSTQSEGGLETTLDEVQVDSLPCSNACSPDGPEGAAELCRYLATEVLPFLAAQTPVCRARFVSCMDECADAGGEDPLDLEDLSGSTEARCLYSGASGSCDGYARSLTVCGGDLDPESGAACTLLCKATFGAWNDAVDLNCVERCGSDEEAE